MCGRFVLAMSNNALQLQLPGFQFSETLSPNYNVAPSHEVPVLTHFTTEAQFFSWGLIPSWAKDPKIAYKLINARGETVSTLASFKEAYQHRRCLIPFNGFYEWKKENKERLPHFIFPRDEFCCLGGLWEEWQGKQTFTVITTPANAKIKPIHDRMPLILNLQRAMEWIQPELPFSSVQSLIKPYPEEQIDFYEVSKAVGSPRNNYAELMNPIEKVEPKSEQLGF